MGKFIIKKINSMKPQKRVTNEIINEEVMTTSEKVELAQSILNNAPFEAKRIKKDKGLIERTESSKTILTEDNKELLKD